MNCLNLCLVIFLYHLVPCHQKEYPDEDCGDEYDDNNGGKSGGDNTKLQQGLEPKSCECTCDPDDYPDGDYCHDTKICTKTCRIIYRLLCYDQFRCGGDLKCSFYRDCFDNCELEMTEFRNRKRRGARKLTHETDKYIVPTNKLTSTGQVSKLCYPNCGGGNNNNNNNNNGGGGNNNNNNNNNGGGGNNNNNNNNNNGWGGNNNNNNNNNGRK